MAQGEGRDAAARCRALGRARSGCHGPAIAAASPRLSVQRPVCLFNRSRRVAPGRPSRSGHGSSRPDKRELDDRDLEPRVRVGRRPLASPSRLSAHRHQLLFPTGSTGGAIDQIEAAKAVCSGGLSRRPGRPFAPRSRVQPLPSHMNGLRGADGMSPNSGDPERWHRHATPVEGHRITERRIRAEAGALAGWLPRPPSGRPGERPSDQPPRADRARADVSDAGGHVSGATTE